MIKRSRFIAWAAPAGDETAARALIDAARAEFPDARHHCSAFRIFPPGANPIERSNDDGEPSGTAGRPILDALRGSDLGNVSAVVTRYFGGTLLGTGGLTRAYADATTAALGAAKIVRIVTTPLHRVSLPVSEAPKLEGWLRSLPLEVVEVAWGAEADYTLAAAPGVAAEVREGLAMRLGRAVDLTPAGTTSREVPAALP